MDPVQSSYRRHRASQERISRTQASVTAAVDMLDRSRAIVARSRVTLSREVVQLRVRAVEVPTVAPAAKTAPAPTADLLEIVSGAVLESQHVVLDGKHFIDCVLRECTLEYHGHPVVLESTQFQGCRFRFGGQAAMTMQFAECFGMVRHDAAETGFGQALQTPVRVN